jgi:hypothetical protein
MARTKPQEPLYGYEGQPPTYTLEDGREIGAGDLVAEAAKHYHNANPGLDESQVAMAWNNLEDARRRDWCESAVESMNVEIQRSAAQVDQANVLDAVAAPAAKQLGAALIDAALTEVKALARPWQQMTADQQDDVLERITRQVRDAVGDTIRMLSTKGAHHIVCELEQITIKKGAKAVLAIPKGELDQDLLDAVSQQVILVIGPELTEARDIPKPAPDPDQPDLLGQAHLGSGVGGDGGADGAEDDGTVQHSDPQD